MLSEGSLFEEVVSFYKAGGADYPIRNIVLIKVERILPLTSPVYDTNISEDEVIKRWSGYWNSVYQMKKEDTYETGTTQPVISAMLAVVDTQKAIVWYKKALGATVLWSLGSVAGLEIAGAVFFLGEPANNGWESPEKLGITSTRVEVFCDDPDTFIARAVHAGANGSFDNIRNHEAPWGIHRQGGFIDPFGHIWLVGDRSPLKRFP